MKRLVLIVAAAVSFAFAPAYGIENIEEILKLSETLQAETERAKAAKTPEEREAIVKELERLTRRMMELAGMTQKDTEAAIATLRESFKEQENSTAVKALNSADKKIKRVAKQLDETQKSMDAVGDKDGKDK
jgi:hypothetical protein